jgi:hypothetical protein
VTDTIVAGERCPVQPNSSQDLWDISQSINGTSMTFNALVAHGYITWSHPRPGEEGRSYAIWTEKAAAWNSWRRRRFG